MTNKFKQISKFLLLVIIFGVSFSSCRQDLETINQSSNGTDSPMSYGLFNYANKALMDFTRDGFTSGRMTLPWVQYSAQRNYTEEDKYQYRLTVGDALWTNLYAVGMDYKKIIELNTDPATKDQQNQYGPNANQIAASRIMLSWIFLNLADSFGDVPYYSYGSKDADFQALDPTNITPKFAPQAKIYADIMKELKESAAMISTSDVVFTKGDRLFGSGLKLKKFANSLRLRVAVRVKGVVPGAETHIQEAIAGGLMTSNSDNVGLTYENNLINPDIFYQSYLTRNDFAINKTMVELLKGNIGPFGQLDPRLFSFAAPVSASKTAIINGTYADDFDPTHYQGMPYGVPTNGIAAGQSASASLFGKKVLRKDFTEMLMDYSEVQFLLSEVNGWSQTEYKNGVEASLKRWDVPAAQITTYLAALTPATKETVLTQKYIALFTQPYEMWADYRRTGYPKVLLLPGQTGTYNTAVSGATTYVFNSLIAGLTDLPNRFYYPTTVQTLNKVNWQSASTAIGGDKMDTHLIWDK